MEDRSAFVRWGFRLALLSAVIAILAVLGLRLGVMPLGVALFAGLGGGMLIALVAIIVSAIGLVLTVRSGRPGRGVALAAIFLSLAVAAPVVSAVRSGSSVPRIHDISTDLVDPPRFAAVLAQRTPSHNSLEVADGTDALDAWALSVFPLSDSHYAIARSVHGGPEYSGRGGLAVVTSALVMTRKQLAMYEFHGVDVARTALTLGNLILRLDRDETLPPATLTMRPLTLPLSESDFTDSTPAILPGHLVNWIARETVSLLRDSRKVMVVGRCDPLPILTLMLDQLTPRERSETSFACGLKPSSRRDFRVQFTQETMSAKLQKDLERSGILPIDIARVLVDTI